MREAAIERSTKETEVRAQIVLDGSSQSKIKTGIGFFDHMLTLFAFHSGCDLFLEAKGDLEVCDHHTIEDCGLVLGDLIKVALQDKRGIHRYGSFTIPMDETLCSVDLDLSGRPYLVYHCETKREMIGTYSTEMTEEFFRALATRSGMTLHINVHYGNNDHHKIEAIFKAFGRALKQAIQIDSDQIVSSKGVLE
ncbi:imidazoleglycerol-phosphate dehydratase HisB [Dubosiella newyorkensis]|jgi:imidazoleglycerol phosphate dehydratase HisB|uniref:Imidazoleglycerol-phosphate dehydratase n=1 Tax=Dubosiella newyorkensis TaxID=1862672 RepID=A0A1U7NNS5_9FIRM|nr:imidazoleglycerol-phosphate dehydratase HisB [Dubosiella newyorkensis]MCI9041364.1 imidazoleglycerol-phosphate dehydratase HisB [Dubosiella newyorkensis]OLU46984.1 imidazoleglycerol-phosphate dehydratase [Dubosiella newyorkensis]